VPDRPTGIRFRWTKNHIRVQHLQDWKTCQIL